MPDRPDNEGAPWTNLAEPQNSPAALGSDPDALREKYLRERDKRLRPEGESQYLVVEGEYAHFANNDPRAGEPPSRDSLTDEIDVVIVGGGFSGMLMAARLREAGVSEIRIVEASADFGGT
jgi:cyclohexanone monooxygenase